MNLLQSVVHTTVHPRPTAVYVSLYRYYYGPECPGSPSRAACLKQCNWQAGSHLNMFRSLLASLLLSPYISQEVACLIRKAWQMISKLIVAKHSMVSAESLYIKRSYQRNRLQFSIYVLNYYAPFCSFDISSTTFADVCVLPIIQNCVIMKQTIRDWFISIHHDLNSYLTTVCRQHTWHCWKPNASFYF